MLCVMAEAANSDTSLDQTISNQKVNVDKRPSDVFIQSLTGGIKRDDVQKMVNDQHHMLSRFEKTNEMLLNFNELSESRYNSTQRDFLQHTQQLNSMKSDLDSVFRRIRLLKSTLSRQYPDAFKACSNVYNVIEDEEEDNASEQSSSSTVTQ